MMGRSNGKAVFAAGASALPGVKLGDASVGAIGEAA